MNRKWSEAETRWLEANLDRMDLQSMAHTLGIPLAEVEKRVKQVRADRNNHPPLKAPATVKEAVKELSAARKDYEKAIELFHKRHLDAAAEKFEDLIEKHPGEKEFVDRARMYLAACRNGQKNKNTPQEPEELYHAAVFEKNRGNVQKALELLKKTGRDGDGRLLYLAACCHALAGESEQALSSLRRAIAADGQTRIQARLDADLSSLRGTPGFSEILTGA
jgi:tetratricopeptide (TPR) repeat protein